jgi:hypothetical protein
MEARIFERSARLPSVCWEFQLLGSWETARVRVPPSATWSYSARSQAVLGSSDCSSAAFWFSSSACFCCSSADCW